jgi:thiol:disulfide interchange protein DsbD
MSKTKTALGILAIILVAAAPAVFGQGSQRVVTARGYVSTDGIRPGAKFKVAVVLEVAEGYHINAHVTTLDYLKATTVTFETPLGIKISEPRYPTPAEKSFEFSPETPLSVLEGKAIITAEVQALSSVKPGQAVLRGLVQVQACNDSMCLAPADLTVEIPLKLVPAAASTKEQYSDVFAGAAEQTAEQGGQNGGGTGGLIQYKGGASESNPLTSVLTKSGLVAALPVIFLAGLLLNLTPCVFPIIPITIGFFVNQGSSKGQKTSIGRALGMATMYVIGMAVTYSVLGVLAAKSGGFFGAALQKPGVLIGLAMLMVVLSLSMFGVYEFRMPQALNRFANKSTQSTTGAVGAFVMGLTMGIVAAPCIGPFVIALLVHVGAKGDALYGFFLFFVLALGLGFPYLFLATFSGSLGSLPRSGLWMVTVRKIFGVALIGMAIYFIAPLLGDSSRYAYIGFFGAAALYFLAWEAARTKPVQFAWVLRAIGVAAGVVAIALALPRRVEAEIAWQPYSEQALDSARREGKQVIIDTFASWCIPCKELDQTTFTDERVRTEAERFVTLKLDLTQQDSSSESGRARSKFNIIGVPTVIFLDATGREQPHLRLEGFEKADMFLDRMKKAGASTVEPSVRNVAAESGPGAPQPAPALSLNVLDGGKLELASLQGKVVLIDFWATWCLPCISEIPTFNQLMKDYADQGLEIVAVSLDEEGAPKIRAFLKEHPMSYSQVMGDSQIASAFGVEESSLPVAVLIDRRGMVRFKHVGITKRETFAEEVRQLLAE